MMRIGKFKHRKIGLFLITILMLSCSEGKNGNQDVVKEKEVNNEAEAAIDIVLNSDTADSNIIQGHINFYRKVSDSLKLLSQDERRIIFAVGLKPYNDSEFEIDTDDIFQENINLQLKKHNDTITLPFSLTKQFNGKAVVSGVVDDIFILKHPDYAESPDLVRMLSALFEFDEIVHLE
ncbi:hypothetical protein [Algoriphagus sediminis]|uniref:Uncharacterized protein n=1 Tax=Algoriphagus sediminis TaxID=3057113 RepID=A0ABT7YA58_9BACT|nr:hypothetical protein [Algoriphagus sediminis]MDN3203405.1 hypothetical protein [Algoriphagus sediminis]